MIVGIGTDLCEIARIEAVLEEQGDKFVNRVLTPAEKESHKITPAFMARRFAAKEAVSKALGTGIGSTIGFQDIMIHRSGNQAPKVVLSAAGQTHFPNVQVFISLSSENGNALAFAVAEKRT